MRVLPLHRDDPADYSCVVYWVLGENNAAADRNTLIDTGSAAPGNLDYYLDQMAQHAKGIGKRAVEQVVLTHGHFDHTGGLPGVEALFHPDLVAWPVRDGATVVVGDQSGVLLHTPGHSDDSICLFLPDTGTLFSGDTLYRISDREGSYPQAYVQTLERLAGLGVRTIYPGHGQPIERDATGFIRGCLGHVSCSHIQD